MNQRIASSFNFSEPFVTAFDAAKFPHKKLYIAGSAGLKDFSLFAGDIDLFQRLKISELPQFEKHIKGLVKTCKEIKSVHFIELKACDHHWSAAQLESAANWKKIKECIKSKKNLFTKVDLIVFDGTYYTEVTIVYTFDTKISKATLIKLLRADSRKYWREHNYYKAIKRLFNVERLQGKVSKHVQDVVLDPILGIISLAKNRLEAYLRIKEPSKKTLSAIKQDLSTVLLPEHQRYLAGYLDKGEAQKALNYIKKVLSNLTLVRYKGKRVRGGFNPYSHPKRSRDPTGDYKKKLLEDAVGVSEAQRLKQENPAKTWDQLWTEHLIRFQKTPQGQRNIEREQKKAKQLSREIAAREEAKFAAENPWYAGVRKLGEVGMDFVPVLGSIAKEGVRALDEQRAFNVGRAAADSAVDIAASLIPGAKGVKGAVLGAVKGQVKKTGKELSRQAFGEGLFDFAKSFFQSPSPAPLSHNQLTRLLAKMSQATYRPLSEDTVIDGFKMVQGRPTYRVYYSAPKNTVVLAVRGTSSVQDVVTDFKFAAEKSQTTQRFTELEKVVQSIENQYKGANFYVTGHSLGGGLIYMLKLVHPELKGEVFNPAINLKVLRSGDQKLLDGIHANIIYGDPVSGFLSRWLPARLKSVYKSPLALSRNKVERLYQLHGIKNFTVTHAGAGVKGGIVTEKQKADLIDILGFKFWKLVQEGKNVKANAFKVADKYTKMIKKEHISRSDGASYWGLDHPGMGIKITVWSPEDRDTLVSIVEKAREDFIRKFDHGEPIVPPPEPAAAAASTAPEPPRPARPRPTREELDAMDFFADE